MADVRLSENDTTVPNLFAVKYWQFFFKQPFNLTNPHKFPSHTCDLQEIFIHALQFT